MNTVQQSPNKPGGEQSGLVAGEGQKADIDFYMTGIDILCAAQ